MPPTVLRDGPAGFGALQWFIDEDDEADVRELPHTHPDELRRLALFDVVINNADRKAGHLLVDRAGKLWGVDHGVTFNEDPKLRTVVWVYESEPIPPELLDGLEAFARSGPVVDAAHELLAAPRARSAVRAGVDAARDRCVPGAATRAVPRPVAAHSEPRRVAMSGYLRYSKQPGILHCGVGFAYGSSVAGPGVLRVEVAA